MELVERPVRFNQQWMPKASIEKCNAVKETDTKVSEKGRVNTMTFDNAKHTLILPDYSCGYKHVFLAEINGGVVAHYDRPVLCKNNQDTDDQQPEPGHLSRSISWMKSLDTTPPKIGLGSSHLAYT